MVHDEPRRKIAKPDSCFTGVNDQENTLIRRPGRVGNLENGIPR
jgi:hypothetical protein